jgi:transcriptional regulator with XRE-family HTH domain
MTDTEQTPTDTDTDSAGYYDQDAATFGDRVAAARRSAGLTQEALARRIGVKLKTLRDWEDDRNEPRANKLQMLAGMLNVSLVWLLTGEGLGVDGPYDEDTAADSFVRATLAEMAEVRRDAERVLDRLRHLETRLKDALAK